MMRELSIANFKCIREARLRLAPLTLLTGLNGAGKSSAIQSLLAIRQSFLMGSLEQGILSTAGELVDIGGPGEVLFEGAEADCIRIGITLIGEDEILFSFALSSDRSTATADISSIQSNFGNLSNGKQPSVLFERIRRPDRPTFHYLHAERYGPRKFLPMSEARTGQFDLGTRGEYVLHFLHEHQDKILLPQSDLRLISNVSERLREQLEGWMNEVSPGAHIDFKPVRQADLIVGSFSFSQEGELRSSEYRATNVGFGLSYVLPVIAALLATRSGSLIIIENPEAHLHPRGQTKLGELCARAAAAGVQVIIETHSDHLMDGVRIAIREGILPPDDAAFHYFQRKGVRSDINSPRIDRQGRLSAWPEGFFDQHRRNAARLVKP